ncbi:MAG: flavin reductase family protein [Candidatus Korarchaeota archaeon]
MMIGPRPVGLVGTWDAEVNRTNLMTASFLMPISFSPPYVAFAVAPSRHTWTLISKVPEFTLNMVSLELREAADICGTHSGRNTDKFKVAKLTPVRSDKIKPEWVKESPIALECVVEDTKLYGDHYIVVGRVVAEHINNRDYKPILHWSGAGYETTQ